MTIERTTVEDYYYLAVGATVTLNTSLTGILLGWDGLGVIIKVGSAVTVIPMSDFTTMAFTIEGVSYTMPSLS